MDFISIGLSLFIRPFKDKTSHNPFCGIGRDKFSTYLSTSCYSEKKKNTYFYYFWTSLFLAIQLSRICHAGQETILKFLLEAFTLTHNSYASQEKRAITVCEPEC